MRPRPFEAFLLLAAVATPLLPGVAAPLVLVALAALWLARRPPRRDVALVGSGLAVAVAALAFRAGVAAPPAPGTPGWDRVVRSGYARLWQELGEEAARARIALPTPPHEDGDRVAAFRTLAAVVERGGEGRGGLLLVDPDGTSVAWAGEGLLHELAPESIPRAGTGFRASFAAVTAIAVVPLGNERRPWRVVAARSYATDRLPFAPRRPALRWSLVDDPSEAAAGARVIQLAGRPALVVRSGPPPPPPPGLPHDSASRLAWLALGFGLFALAVTRIVGLALLLPPAGAAPGAPRGERIAGIAQVTAAGLGAALAGALAAGAAPASLAALPVAAVLAVAGLALPRPHPPGPAPGRGRRVQAAVAGVIAVAGVVGGAVAAQSWSGPADLAPRFFGAPTLFVLRLALATAAVGLLALTRAAAPAAAPDPRRHPGEGWAWLAVVLLATAGALCDLPAAALALLAAGGGAAARWIQGRPLRRPAQVAVLLLIAALASSAAWETVHREALRRDLAVRVAPRVGPPPAAESAALSAGIERFFTSGDLSRFVPRTPEGLERQDLAFLLWQASPLAHPNVLSSLVVRLPDGPPSTFGFGLPLTEDGTADWAVLRWQEVGAVAPRERLLRGAADLTAEGRRWARVEWTLLPLPGFRLAPEAALEEIEAALLRGGPSLSRLPGLPPSVELGLYDAAGKALVSPWQEAPPRPPELAPAGGRMRVVPTPAGPAWAVGRDVPGARAVLYLPVLSPLAALERVGSHLLGVLLVALVAAFAAVLLALPRAAFRDLLRTTVRSYSKRLLLVYTVLLLVPLLLLNAVLVAGIGDRLRREQRAAGEAALSAAQRVLGDYLETLEPGFDLASELDDTLLIWLSRVVRHEVNLYWGSEIWASTKPELFAARLLPKRIPGESFARIGLLGYDLASRTNRVGEASYLELYAPLEVPGEDLGPRNFFLSMPLLAQQEEVARELAALRRQALLVTAALVMLVAALGARLSRGFTRPLTELVEGTRRIAAGAPSLDLAPSELELAALVEAVDEMARRIAEGRERLVREKQVVERIVEHITSGVVSLDRERRVLMRNRVAAELLGVEVGDRLAEVLPAVERLAPVAAWLAGVAGDQPSHRTVRLPAGGAPADGDGGDGDGPAERDWTLVWVPVPGAGEPSALLVVEDATETLRGQRLEAWAEMARIIAHEIKNPLTPIRLNVEHMQQVWHDRGRGDGPDGAHEHFERVFERCTANVLRAGRRAAADRGGVLDLQPDPAHRAAAGRPGRGGARAGGAVRDGAAARCDRAGGVVRAGAGRHLRPPPAGAGRAQPAGERPARQRRGRPRGAAGGASARSGRRRRGRRRSGGAHRRPRLRAGHRARPAAAHLRSLLLDPRHRDRARAADRPPHRRGARRHDRGPQPAGGWPGGRPDAAAERGAMSGRPRAPRIGVGWLAAALALGACGGAGDRPAVPAGDAVAATPATWARLSGADVEALRRAGVREVFVTVAALGWDGAGVPRLERRWPSAASRPVGGSGLPVALAVRGAWRSAAEPAAAAEALAPELVALGREAVERGWSPVGLHLDLVPPADADGLAAYGAALGALRRRLGPGLWLGAGVDHDALGREGADAVAAGCDLLVAGLYGPRPGGGPGPGPAAPWGLEDLEADVARLEGLGTPYLVGVTTLGRVVREGSAPPATTTRGDLHGLLAVDGLRPAGAGVLSSDVDRLTFRAERRLRWGDWTLERGDRLRLERPYAVHLRRLRARLAAAGSALHRGELYLRLPAPGEGFGLSAARLAAAAAPPAPPRLELSVTVVPGRGRAVQVEVAHRGVEPTAVSLLDGNYVEVRLGSGAFGRVDPGGFGRYELDRDGRRARDMAAVRAADALRLFVAVLEPGDEVTSGPIEVSDPAAVTVGGRFVMPDGSLVELPTARPGDGAAGG